jgi:class 3 adenylate cyclase/tetratricopeptide (TPR) repeat protein
VTCTRCGTTNRAGAKFCVECGSPLSATCPACGSPIDPGAKFCPECGRRLVGAAPTPPGTESASAPAPRSDGAGATERRLVSVLFADLVGFTTLAEARDSEAVRDLLSRYFERATEIVERYGGTVEKFIGDAVMAVWGTPVAHEDDAERAVRAALDLVAAVAELGGDAGIDGLDARAGVMTGETAVTIGAQNQGMVAGDLVNTASRLQSVADPGSVLVGEATRRAAEGAIAFDAAGDQALKGKAEAIPVFRALRVVATVGGAVRSDSLEPPFVGRETEFRLLRELFHATGRERRARLVSLTGQAGIGKSRLAWEFQKYLDGISEVLWWHHGRSPAYGEGITFWALGEMIRKRAGLLEGDDDETSRARLAASVAEHVGDPKERAFVEPALLALLGLDESPPGGRDRLFAGWRLFLERLSAASTVVLVFEDLQWADDGLLDFIEHLLEWSRSYPIFVVTLARPELLDRRPTWGVAGRSASSLALGPLGEPEMRELLAGLVPGLPEGAVRSVLERADGIPLYAVETVRMLLSAGRLEPDGEGRFRPTGALDALEVPATLQALIAARLDALDPSDRALLQDASVLGKTFTIEALAAVGGAEPGDLEPRLRGLVARELLELDTDPASPERGQYGFVQALIREVAYSTLARRDRRVRHLAAARFFEARGEDELAPVLASHYLDAYRASPEGPEGAAVGAQARISLRAAAERAMSLGSYRSGVTFLEQAMGIAAGEPADEAELLERAGLAAVLGGEYDRATELLERAVARWREVGDAVPIGRAIALQGLALLNGAHGEVAFELLERARAEFDGPEHELARAPIVARIGQLMIRRGAGLPALQAAEEMLPVAERHRLVELLVDALLTKAAALSHMGRQLEGGVLVEGALRMAEERGLVEQQMRGMTNVVVQLIDEDPWRALEQGEDAINRALRYGVLPAFVIAVLNMTETAIRVGAWERGDADVDRALGMDLDSTDRGIILLSPAILALYRGHRDDERALEFRALARNAVEGPLAGGTFDLEMIEAQLNGDHETAYRVAVEQAQLDDLNAPSCYERAGRAAVWLGDPERAWQVHRAFADLGRVAPFPAAQLLAIEAGALALEGRRDEAVERYQEAARRYREMRLAFDGAVIRLDAARVLGIGTPEGRAAADEARSVFERLAARRLIEQVDALAGTPGASATPDRTRKTESAPA